MPLRVCSTPPVFGCLLTANFYHIDYNYYWTRFQHKRSQTCALTSAITVCICFASAKRHRNSGKPEFATLCNLCIRLRGITCDTVFCLLCRGSPSNWNGSTFELNPLTLESLLVPPEGKHVDGFTVVRCFCILDDKPGCHIGPHLGLLGGSRQLVQLLGRLPHLENATFALAKN